MDSDAQSPLPARLERLEEVQTFSEHRADQLSEQMAALEHKLRDMELRVRRLEDGVGRLDEQVAKVAPPTSKDTEP